MATDFRVEELELQVATLTRRLIEAEQNHVQAEEKLARMTVEVAVRDAVAKSGTPIHPAALPDLIKRASALEWRKLDDGRLVALDGHMPMLDNFGHDVTPKVWLDGLASEAPHLFQDGDTASGTAQGNPFVKGASFSLTEQGRIARENPALAKTLAQAAGRTLDEV